MGTKLTPGKFDCLGNLEPDEPYFVLMARDPAAASLVRRWAEQRKAMINSGTKPPADRAQVDEALNCADQMDAWRYTHRVAR